MRGDEPLEDDDWPLEIPNYSLRSRLLILVGFGILMSAIAVGLSIASHDRAFLILLAFTLPVMFVFLWLLLSGGRFAQWFNRPTKGGNIGYLPLGYELDRRAGERRARILAERERRKSEDDRPRKERSLVTEPDGPSDLPAQGELYIDGKRIEAPLPEELRSELARMGASGEQATGSVKWWRNEEGVGLVATNESPSKEVWVHFSTIEMDGFKYLTTGERVELRYEEEYVDGFHYRATWVRPID